MFFGRSDSPLNVTSEDTEDYLDVQAYERGLHDFVRNCETPMTIGLQGEWGSGKTSLMRGVEKRLRGQPRDRPLPKHHPVLPFWFDTWQYGAVGAADALGMLLLRDLTNRLMAELEESSVLHMRHRIARALKHALPQVAGGLTAMATRSDFAGEAVAATGSTFTSQQDDVRDCFEKLVDAALADKPGENPRVVVFIDDLDRVPPALAVQLLEVLKNFMDVPRCVFVVACDYEVVRAGVHGLMGITGEADKRAKKEKVDAFFHKLFQVQFLMPVGAYQIDKLLEKYVRARLLDGNKESGLLGKTYHTKRYDEFLSSGYVKSKGPRVHTGWFKDLTRVIETAIGTNPRSFKRFLNAVDLTCCVDEAFDTKDRLAHWAIGSPELDEATRRWFTALFPVVALQQRWPEVATYLLSNATRRSRAKSAAGDAAFTDLERRLRTLTGHWPTVEDASVIEDQFVAEDFRILLSSIFDHDVHASGAPAAATDLVRFAKTWFSLLNADGDDLLDETEVDTLGRWSERLGNMGATHIQPTGMAKFYLLAMEADDTAGDAFFGLASRLRNLCRDEELVQLEDQGSDTGATWTLLPHGGSPTKLMSFSIKGTSLEIQLNVRAGATPVRHLPRVEALGETLEEVLRTYQVATRSTSQRLLVDFGLGYSAAREQPIREAFVTFLRDVAELARQNDEARFNPPDPLADHGPPQSETAEQEDEVP